MGFASELIPSTGWGFERCVAGPRVRLASRGRLQMGRCSSFSSRWFECGHAIVFCPRHAIRWGEQVLWVWVWAVFCKSLTADANMTFPTCKIRIGIKMWMCMFDHLGVDPRCGCARVACLASVMVTQVWEGHARRHWWLRFKKEARILVSGDSGNRETWEWWVVAGA